MKPVEHDVVTTYQHISNGGLSFSLFESVRENGKKSHGLELMLSNYGVNHRTIIPAFATTAPILRAIADEIDRLALTDPSYLSSVDAEVTWPATGVTKYFRNHPEGVLEVGRAEIYSSDSAQMSGEEDDEPASGDADPQA
jgi:hypothetical protein